MDDPRTVKASIEKGNISAKMFYYIFSIIDKPAEIFRTKIVEPLRTGERPKYYHRKFGRHPGIDECRENDQVCIHEANDQFKRDRQVDSHILDILHERQHECEFYYGGHHTPDGKEKCGHLRDMWEEAAGNFFEKYGDIGATGTVVDAYMKQKHRMIWERRHGKVGGGEKKNECQQN